MDSPRSGGQAVLPSGGIVGDRQLVAVQTVDLGRLTHHPVPLLSGALISVSARGPIDSMLPDELAEPRRLQLHDVESSVGGD